MHPLKEHTSTCRAEYLSEKSIFLKAKKLSWAHPILSPLVCLIMAPECFRYRKGNKVLRDGGSRSAHIYSLQQSKATQVSSALTPPQRCSAVPLPRVSHPLKDWQRSNEHAAEVLLSHRPKNHIKWKKSVRASQVAVSHSVLSLPSAFLRFASHFGSRKSYATLAVPYAKAYIRQFCSTCWLLTHPKPRSHRSSLAMLHFKDQWYIRQRHCSVLLSSPLNYFLAF